MCCCTKITKSEGELKLRPLHVPKSFLARKSLVSSGNFIFAFMHGFKRYILCSVKMLMTVHLMFANIDLLPMHGPTISL